MAKKQLGVNPADDRDATTKAYVDARSKQAFYGTWGMVPGEGTTPVGLQSGEPLTDGRLWIAPLEGNQLYRWNAPLGNEWAQNLHTNPSFETATTAAAVETRRNLATDPAATTVGTTVPAGGSGWTSLDTFGTGGAGTYSTLTGLADGPSGVTTAARKTYTTAPTAMGIDVYGSGFVHHTTSSQNSMVVQPGGTYAFSAHLRPSWAGTSGYMLIAWYSSTGSRLSLIASPHIALTAGAWTQVGGVYVAPAGAVRVRLHTRLTDSSTLPTAGATLDGTGLLIEAGAITPTVTRTNVATDPSAMTGAWSASRWFAGGAGTYTFVSAVDDGPNGLTTYRRKTWTTAATSTADTGFSVNALADGTRYAVRPGQTFRASAWLRASVANKYGQMRAQFYSANGTLLGTFAGTDPVQGWLTPNTWMRIAASFTAPAGAVAYNLLPDIVSQTGAINWGVGETLDGTGLLIENATLGSVATRRNRLINPSAELTATGFGIGSSGTDGASTFSRATTGGFDDGAYVRMTMTTANTAGSPYLYCGGSTGYYAEVDPGTIQTASAWVRSSRAVSIRAVLVTHTSAAGAGWTSANGADVTLTPNVWTRISVNGTPAAGNSWARVVVEARDQTLAVGDTLDMDGVMIESSGGTLRDYFDGSYYGAVWTGTAHGSPSTQVTISTAPAVGTYFDGTYYGAAWTGTSDASSSTFRPHIAARVLSYFDGVRPPNLDSDFVPAWLGTANNSNSVLRVTGPAQASQGGTAGHPVRSGQWATVSGAKSLRIHATNGLNNDTYAIVAQLNDTRVPLIPGRTYTAIATSYQAEALATTGGTSGNGSRQMVFISLGGNLTVRSTQAPNVAGVTQHRMTFTVPANSTYAMVRLYLGHTYGDIWWDDVAIFDHLYTGLGWTGPYFDGDSWSTVTRWAGTPHDSTSYYEPRWVNVSPVGRHREVTTLLAASGSYDIPMSAGFTVIRLTVSAAARVRLYRTATQRTEDLGRAFATTPVADEVLFDYAFTKAGEVYLNPVPLVYLPDGETTAYLRIDGQADFTMLWQRQE